MSTLLEVLQRKNPDIIDHWDGSDCDDTTSSRLDNVSLDDASCVHVQQWEDFTFESIYLAYGDILDQSVDAAYREACTPTATPRTISDGHGLFTLGVVWSCNIERAPLKVAGRILRKRPGMATADLAGETDPTLAAKLISWTHADDQQLSITPDWVVVDHKVLKKYSYDHKEEPAKSLVYAVGDSILKQEWKSTWLTLIDAECVVETDPPYNRPGTPVQTHHQTKMVKVERVRPLKQLATYCRLGETRYGYLITQTELVAMRIRRIPGPEEHNAAVEYRAIPWAAHGSKQLTVHLAICALGCMGMNDAHRAMQGPGLAVLPHMAKLTWWKEDKETKTFTNVISQRVIDGDKWAKLHADVGVDIQLDDTSGLSHTNGFIVAPPPPATATAPSFKTSTVAATAHSS